MLKVATISITEGSKTVKKSGLVTSSGRAVYLLTGDTTKHPECTSQGCLGDWPAVTSSAKKPVLGKGVTGKVTVWKHNGVSQLVLNGHPLYTYAADSSADKDAGRGSGQLRRHVESDRRIRLGGGNGLVSGRLLRRRFGLVTRTVR